MKNKKLKPRWERIITALLIFIILLIFITKLNVNKDSKENTNKQVTEQQEIKEVLPTNATEEVKLEVCELGYVSCLIKIYADYYNIDYKLAIAISKHETGHYTSAVFKNLNNVGGNFGLRDGKYQLLKFDTLEDGVEFFVKNLKNNYFNKGLTTIEQIQKKYAPIGAENDPEGLNNYWTSGVRSIYESLEE